MPKSRHGKSRKQWRAQKHGNREKLEKERSDMLHQERKKRHGAMMKMLQERAERKEKEEKEKEKEKGKVTEKGVENA